MRNCAIIHPLHLKLETAMRENKSAPFFSSLAAGLDIHDVRERAKRTASRVTAVKEYGFMCHHRGRLSQEYEEDQQLP